MALKDIDFSVAMYGTTPIIQSNYDVAYTGDESSINLRFAVTDEPELEGATAILHLKFADSSHIERSLELTESVFSYTLKGTENKHAGVVRADIIITKGGAKFTRAGHKFKIDTSLDASVPLIEYAVDTLDTLMDGAEEWLLQTQIDFGIAQSQRADEWVADNDARADEFAESQTDRTNAFDASEAARTTDFNASETGRSNTFTVNENAREAAAESGEAARGESFELSEYERATTFGESEAGRVITFNGSEADRTIAFNTAEAARSEGYTKDHDRAGTDHTRAENDHDIALTDQENYDTLLTNLQETINDANENIAEFDVALQNGIVATNIAAELQNLEETYAPNIVSLTSQLAEAESQIDLLNRGLGETYATLVALQTAYPTGDTKDHIVGADGHRYYWNDTAWADGGAYQAIEITTGAVDPIKLSKFVAGKNLIDPDTFTTGFLLGSNGSTSVSDGYKTTSKFLVKPSQSYTLSSSREVVINFYTVSNVFISYTLITLAQAAAGYTVTSPSNAYYGRFSAHTTATYHQMEEGTVKTTSEPFSFKMRDLVVGEVVEARDGEQTLKDRLFEIEHGDITYKVTSKLSEMAPDFYTHWKLKDKDLVVEILGDSLSTLNNYTTPRTDVKTRPPLMIEYAYPSYIEELLRWDGQEYKRFDVEGIFTESYTTATNLEYDGSAWDWLTGSTFTTNRPSITRILEGTNCSVSYTIPASANRCDFIYRTDYLNAPNAVVAISKGNGFVQVYDYTTDTWVEANGYSYSAKEADEILVWSAPNYYRESIYQRRLKMKTTKTKNDGTIGVTITNNGAGRLTYWGIQHSPLNYFIDVLANARGGHSITKLRKFERVDVDVFKPDLILLQLCTNNEGIIIANSTTEAPIDRGTNTPSDMASRFLVYINALEAKTYTPTVISYTLFHAYATMWTSRTSDKVLYGYSGENKITGFDYHDYIEANLRANNKKRLSTWDCMREESKLKAKRENSIIMNSVLAQSGKTGKTWTVDGTHHNDLGAKVIFEIMKDFFVN